MSADAILDTFWGEGALFDQISDAVKAAMANAWDEGCNAGFESGWHRGHRGTADNPYRMAS